MTNALWLAALAASAAMIYCLLALWAALGRGPWFVRAATVAGAIGMLIPAPAFDLAIVFSSQSLAIIAPIWLLDAARSVRRKKTAGEASVSTTGRAGHRFSLADLFLFTIVAAGIASLGAYLPAKHREFWLSYALVGVGAGVVSLAAAWAALGRRWLILRWGLLLAMASGVGYALHFVELPKELDEALFSIEYYVNFFEPGSPEWFALASICLSAAGIAIWLALLTASGWLAFFKRNDSPNGFAGASRWRRWPRPTARTGVVLLALTASVFFAIAYIKILFPLPIPHVETPEPNGYLVLAKLGAELEQADILTLDPPSETQIRDFVAANRERLKEARAALKLPHFAPVDYESPKLDWLDSLQDLRQLARGLAALGKAESLDGRPDAAATIYLDGMRLGEIARRGGLLVHALVGNSIKGGLSGLLEVRPSLSPEMARQLIESLQRLDAEREPFAAVERRELCWQQHAYGWAARLIVDTGPLDAGKNSDDATSARVRLLICDLAVRLFRTEHGKLPERLQQLAPEYLRELPIDPYSGQPLVYRASGEKYVLYSFGPDRKDDGGQPTANNFPVGEGDLVLVP